MQNEYFFTIITDDPHFISELFEVSSPIKGDKIDLHDFKIEYVSSKIKPGIATSEIAINIAISFATGIPASLIANLIWQKISKEGKYKVKNKEKRKILIKKEDFEVFFTEEVKTSSEKDV